MAENTVTDGLVDHFQRVCKMLGEAVEGFTDEAWLSSEEGSLPPARIGYHILGGSERYTWPGTTDEFTSKRRIGLDWEKAPLTDLPGRAETVEDFHTMEARCIQWLREHGDAGLTGKAPTWPWTGKRVLGQALYLLRHLQHHAGELNKELRRRDLPAVEWE